MDNQDQKPKRCSVIGMVNDCLDAKSYILSQWKRPIRGGVDQRAKGAASRASSKRGGFEPAQKSREESQAHQGKVTAESKSKHTKLIQGGGAGSVGSVGSVSSSGGDGTSSVGSGSGNGSRWDHKLPKLVRDIEGQDAHLYRLHKQKVAGTPTAKGHTSLESTPACSGFYAATPTSTLKVTAATVLLNEPLSTPAQDSRASLGPSVHSKGSKFGCARLNVASTTTAMTTTKVVRKSPCTGSIGTVPSNSDVATLSASIDSSLQSRGTEDSGAEGQNYIDAGDLAKCVNEVLAHVENLNLDALNEHEQQLVIEGKTLDVEYAEAVDDVVIEVGSGSSDEVTPRLDLESLPSVLSQGDNTLDVVETADDCQLEAEVASLEPKVSTSSTQPLVVQESDAIVEGFFSGSYDKTPTFVASNEDDYEEFSHEKLSGSSLASPRSNNEFQLDEEELAKVESLVAEVLNLHEPEYLPVLQEEKVSDSNDTSEIFKYPNPSNETASATASASGSLVVGDQVLTAQEVAEKQGYCTLADVGVPFQLENIHAGKLMTKKKVILDDVLVTTRDEYDDTVNPPQLSCAADEGTPMGQPLDVSDGTGEAWEIDDACFDAVISDDALGVAKSALAEVTSEGQDKDLDAQYEAIVLESKQTFASLDLKQAVADDENNENKLVCPNDCLYKVKKLPESDLGSESFCLDSAVSSAATSAVAGCVVVGDGDCDGSRTLVPTFVESPITQLTTHAKVKEFNLDLELEPVDDIVQFCTSASIEIVGDEASSVEATVRNTDVGCIRVQGGTIDSLKESGGALGGDSDAFDCGFALESDGGCGPVGEVVLETLKSSGSRCGLLGDSPSVFESLQHPPESDTDSEAEPEADLEPEPAIEAQTQTDASTPTTLPTDATASTAPPASHPTASASAPTSSRLQEDDAIAVMLRAATRGLGRLFDSDDEITPTDKDESNGSSLSAAATQKKPSTHSLQSTPKVVTTDKEVQDHLLHWDSKTSVADSMPPLSNVTSFSGYTTELGNALVDVAERLFGSDELESLPVRSSEVDKVETAPKSDAHGSGGKISNLQGNPDVDSSQGSGPTTDESEKAISADRTQEAIDLVREASKNINELYDEYIKSNSSPLAAYRKYIQDIKEFPQAEPVPVESVANPDELVLDTLDSFQYGTDGTNSFGSSGSADFERQEQQIQEAEEVGVAEETREAGNDHNNGMLPIQEVSTSAGPSVEPSSVANSAENTRDAPESLDSSFGSAISSQASSAVESIKHTMSALSRQLDVALGTVQQYPSRIFTSGEVSSGNSDKEKKTKGVKPNTTASTSVVKESVATPTVAEDRAEATPKSRKAKNTSRPKSKPKKSPSSKYWLIEGFF